jgi:hypothetical protein
MSGVRIHHPTLRDCTLIVPHPGGDGRNPKDYHVRLDANGDCIVSETVWFRLEEARLSGVSPHEFIVLNEVLNPPSINVNDGSFLNKAVYRQVAEEVKKVRPNGSPQASKDDMNRRVVEALKNLTPPGVRPRIERGGSN